MSRYPYTLPSCLLLSLPFELAHFEHTVSKMRFFAAILARTMFLLIVPHYAVYADIDDSTDLFLTFGTDVMTDTSPYPYHQSVSAWYETFLKVAVRFEIRSSLTTLSVSFAGLSIAL